MRILFLCKRYYTSKDLLGDRFGRLYHLPVELARLGESVQVMALDYRHASAAFLSAQGVNFSTVPATLRKLPFLPFRLAGALRRDPPDILVASGDSHIGFLGMMLARWLGVRFVFDVYDYYPVFAGNRIPGMKPMFARAAAGADLLLCASAPLLQRLQPSNPRCLLVENGVDRELFRPVPPRGETQEKAGPVIGYFGSINPARGPLLIEACRQLRPQWPGLRLLLAGPCAGVGVEEPWIDFRGELAQHEIPALIADCDVVTIPYLPTPFNEMSGACKLAEYLACRKPIVATRIAGHAQDMGEDAAGLCAPDPEDMARAIRRQLEAPQVLPFPERFTWTGIAGRLQASLRQLEESAAVAGVPSARRGQH